MFIFLLVIVSIVPLFSLIVGISWNKKPHKKINHKSGYRTSLSTKNKETWNFAQKHHSKVLIITGLLSLTVSLLAMFIFRERMGLMAVVLIIFNILVYSLSMIPTENALKKNFDKKGNRLK